MLARLSALVIWALVAATVVFWGLRLGSRPAGVPANALPVGDAAMRGDLARLLGAPPREAPVAAVAPETASRFRLLGVMAPKRAAPAGSRAYGVALIAVDGNPAKAFAVGSQLDDELVLQSVSLRSASIGPAAGASALLLELPALPPPATGNLPSARMPAPNGVFVPGQPRMQRMPTPMPAPQPAPELEDGQPENINPAAPTE